MTTAIKARTAHICERCHTIPSIHDNPTIGAGYRYLRHTAFPDGETNTSHGSAVGDGGEEIDAESTSELDGQESLFAIAGASPMINLPPVWLLDVDGVINARRPGWGGPPRKRGCWSASDAYEYTICWAPPLIDRIRDLHETGIVEVRWCTTWCCNADALERLWALPPLPRAFTAPVKGDEASAAKLAAVRRVLAEGRRLVWTDDTEVPTSGDLHDELIADGRALLIRPKGATGLQPEHLDAIERFTRETP